MPTRHLCNKAILIGCSEDMVINQDNISSIPKECVIDLSQSNFSQDKLNLFKKTS